MKRVEEDSVWRALRAKASATVPEMTVAEGITLDLNQPCTVLGGRNGAGKSRILRSLAESLGDRAVYLDIHHLTEQALIVLRSREDFAEMTSEVDAVGPTEKRREDLGRIVGRSYESVDWFEFEVELSDKEVGRKFSWNGETPLIPYFEVEHQGMSYSSRDMGLGEFSVHFLFWILEQYRERRDLVLLLDEPDAYLPPIGSSSLLLRALNLCLERDWKIVLSTHSAEMMERALEQEAFVLLRAEKEGAIVALHSADNPSAADSLMTDPPIRNVIFVEDESAWMLTNVLMEVGDRRLPRTSTVVWGGGTGYMIALQEHFPRTPASRFAYAYVFDGDQRTEVGKSRKTRWPAVFLPTSHDPDVLYKMNGKDPNELAVRLNVPLDELVVFLDTLEGLDPHDWVNDLGKKYGRQKTLRVLAEMWVNVNETESTEWYAHFLKALK